MAVPATVVKIGGSMAEDREALTQLAQELASLQKAGDRLLLVHGGGKDISRNLAWLGQEAQFLDGLRVTDAAAVDMVEMTLTGRVNKMLVRLLLAAGAKAAGISGVDGGLLRCRPLRPDGTLGYVGAVRAVDVSLLEALWNGGFLPVVSPVSLGDDFRAWNVNADQAAADLACALGARALLLVSDVPGVLRDGGIVPRIAVGDVEGLVADGIVSGGMIPKLRSAVQTVAAGVGSVSVAGWSGPGSLGRILSGSSGTRLA
jgi:acetylglutamate kinase